MKLTADEYIFIDNLCLRLKKRKLIYFTMDTEDKKILYKKCLWKSYKMQRKIAKSFFNYCNYQSSKKNKLWKYYHIKIK